MSYYKLIYEIEIQQKKKTYEYFKENYKYNHIITSVIEKYYENIDACHYVNQNITMECFTFKIDDGTFEIEFVENEEYENINYYIKFSPLMDDEKIK